MFVRPEGAFSRLFNAQTIEQQASEEEKKSYKEFKQNLQKVVLENIMAMKWETTTSLNSSQIVYLKERIEKKGFGFTYIEGNTYAISDWEDGYTNPKVKITLPEQVRQEQEDGYFSDGWNSSFKASKVRQEISKQLNQVYMSLATEIEKTISNHKDYDCYRFDIVNSYPERVLGWIVEDLENKGFKTEKESGCTEEDDFGHTSSYHYIQCKLPNSKMNRLYLAKL